MLKAIYIDGETKTGKGAASQAMAQTLQTAGLKVYYDVAGDFYRYVALVRQYLELSEDDDLPTGANLQAAAEAVQVSQRAYRPDDSLGDLQRPSISRSVSVLGELPIAQDAAIAWWKISAEQALAAGADVIVIDGRNPRNRMAETGYADTALKLVLDLYMICEAPEAARRTLIGRGISEPNGDQISQEIQVVTSRRERDRQRADRPFVAPELSVLYGAGPMDAAQAIEASWKNYTGVPLPVAIMLDNTNLAKPDMLAIVTALADAAINY